MAPPFGLTWAASSATPSSRRQASPCAAKASLISITSISSMRSPAMPSAFWVAGTGPMPITRGGTPAAAMATIRAIGVNPCASRPLADASNSAAAPSLTPDALPAVTVMPSPLTPLRAASCSGLVLGRGCSSVSTITGSPRRCGIITGVISSANFAAACAAAQRCCDRSAKASWSARLIS